MQDFDLERLNQITQKILGCAFNVSNGLGTGFLEKVYENALAHELRKANLNISQQQSLQVEYDGIIVGAFVADIVVENMVVVELKVCRDIEQVHIAQLMNYLKATGLKVGLLLNFGTAHVGVKRIIL